MSGQAGGNRTGARRRTNRERTAQTRGDLIRAAIDCLYRLGYQSATTQVIAQEAALSRGALQYQFASKVDLMLAVAESVIERQAAFYDEALGRLPREQHFAAITALTWDAMQRPDAIALIEIMVGSRSDPELASRFPPVADRLERRQRATIWLMARAAGLRDRRVIGAMVHLHLAAMRGLAISQLFSEDRRLTDDAVALLLWYKGRMTGALAAGELELDGVRLAGAPSSLPPPPPRAAT